MRLLNRLSSHPGRWFDDELLWGVTRREGHGDTDDPKAHSGVTQHAFEFGRDEQAICGYEPPKRDNAGFGPMRPQLALAGPGNPQCSKCAALIVHRPTNALAPESTASASDGHASRMGQERAPRAAGWGPRDMARRGVPPGDLPPRDADPH